MLPPIQQLVRPEVDPVFHQMIAAYEGEPSTWAATTRAMRDAMVAHARRTSPFYRARIPAGAPFEEIPLLTKDHLRERLEDIVADGIPEVRRFLARSSGSTGMPVTVYRDTGQLLTDAAADRFHRWLHGISQDATIVITVASPTAGLTRSAVARRRLGARLRGTPAADPWIYRTPARSMTPPGLPAELRSWSRLRSYFLEGPASRLDWIAEQIERRGLELPKRPEAVVATADMLSDHARARIERVFGCPVGSRYGATEMVWIATSTPGDPSRFLFNPLLTYVEVLDERGEPAPPGVPGRLVLTDLHNWAMPLIRYDIGDLAARSAGGHIGGFPLIEQLVGRPSEVLRLPSGRIIGGALLGNFLFGRIHGERFGSHVRFFQCAQTAPNAIELRVVWARPPGQEVREGIAETMRELTDPDTEIRVVDIDDLDRLPSGKVWLVRREDARVSGVDR